MLEMKVDDNVGRTREICIDTDIYRQEQTLSQGMHDIRDVIDLGLREITSAIKVMWEM